MTGEVYKKYGASINELFAVYIIESLTRRVSVRKDIDDYFTAETHENMVYNFMHRDISEESLILYLGSLLNVSLER